MKSAKVQIKDKDNHPINILMLAAEQIVEMFLKAHKQAGGEPNPQICLPVWIDKEKKMLITIEQGTQTEAQYAIFKAQKEVEK